MVIAAAILHALDPVVRESARLKRKPGYFRPLKLIGRPCSGQLVFDTREPQNSLLRDEKHNYEGT